MWSVLLVCHTYLLFLFLQHTIFHCHWFLLLVLNMWVNNEMSFALYFFSSFQLPSKETHSFLQWKTETRFNYKNVYYNIWIMFCYSVQLTIDIVGVARTDAKKEREREEKKIETFFLQLTHSVRCFCFSLSASHSVIFLCGFRFTYFAWRERQRKRTYSNRNQDYNSFFFNRLKLNCIQRLCAVHCLCAYDCNIFWWPLK